MSVDVTDLVDSLKREVNPPGTDLFPTATDDDWDGQLLDAFWECQLLGMLEVYTMNEDGLITNKSAGGDDIPRDLQQLIVFVAGLRCLRRQMANLKTQQSYKAGPVAYETQQSAQLLRDLFAELQERLKIILERLSDVGTTKTFVIDGIRSRFESFRFDDTWWIR